MKKNSKVDIRDYGEFRVFVYPEDVSMVVVSGDIHGDFSFMTYKITQQYSIENALVIIAGDCGFGFNKENYYHSQYKKDFKRLDRANVYVGFMRGNHDNPAYFKNSFINKERWLSYPDYSIIQAAGKNILVVGGAVSVDRMYRIKRAEEGIYESTYAGRLELKPASWWPDEAFVYKKDIIDKMRESGIQIDCVVTHSAPSFCEFVSEGGLLSHFAKDDEHLVNDVKEERHQIDLMYEQIISCGWPIKDWVYGHFHSSWHSKINEIMFSMLDICELKELR